MLVVNHHCLPHESRDGCECRLVATATLGGDAAVEVHVLHLEAGAATPPARTPGALVVLALAGSGKQRLDGTPQAFAAPCTLHVPAGTAQQIVNNGATPLQLVVIAGAGPASPRSAP